MNIGDPKRPKNIRFFSRENVSEDAGDFFQIISMMFGVASFMLKVELIFYIVKQFFFLNFNFLVKMGYMVELNLFHVFLCKFKIYQ